MAYRGVFVTAMGWMRKRIRGSKVENVHKCYVNRLITASISKMYTNGLHHVGGVQKGGNSDTFRIEVAHSGEKRVSPTWSITQFQILTKIWLFKD